jgi:hypothetical protein
LGMAKNKQPSLPNLIRKAIAQDGRTIYRLSLDCGVSQAVLGRFVRGERDMNLRTASKVCDALGLGLRPVRKKG